MQNTMQAMEQELDTAGVLASPQAQARGAREEGYWRLLECYRSGQVEESEWSEHMQDDDFRCWFENLGR